MKTLNSILMNSSVKAGALAILALLPLSAQNNPAVPPSGWMQIGQPIHLSSTISGSSDLGHYTVPRSNIKMTIDTSLTVYKTIEPVNTYDYYLVTGLQRHAVQGYASNWVSLGYYAKSMGLTISGNGAYLADFGPQSTVGSDTTSWSVGGSIGFEGKNPTGSASFSFGQSFSSPNVKFETTGGTDTLSVKTILPGDLGDPKPPSKAGYGYYVAAVFRVPRNQGLTLTVASAASWQYEYTRLVVNDKKTASNMGQFYVDFTDKQIINGNGGCLTVQGGQVATASCDTYSQLQKWTYTRAGQLQNPATQTCVDKDSIFNGLIATPCDPNSTSQQYMMGAGGCTASGDSGCVFTMLPGMFSSTRKAVIAPSLTPGQQLQLLNGTIVNPLLAFWRVQ